MAIVSKISRYRKDATPHSLRALSYPFGIFMSLIEAIKRAVHVLIPIASVAGLSTASAQEKPIGILLAAGDIVTCSSDSIRNGNATAELVKQEIAKAAALDPGLEVRVLALGDLAYPSGSSKSMACFASTWGQFKNKILPVPGNHDYGTNRGAAYFEYFKSTLTDLKADKKISYYALDFPSTGSKKWRLIGLNGEMSTGRDGQQVKWLRNELAQAKGSCVLAFSHGFFYSSGRHGHDDGHGKPQNSVIDITKPLLPGKETREIFSALYSQRASVFLAGHDHHFEQLGRANADASVQDFGKSAMVEDGVRSFVVGTGGKRLYSDYYQKKWAFTEAYDYSSHGILRIELRPTSYSWRFIPVGAGSSMRVVKQVESDDCNLPK